MKEEVKCPVCGKAGIKNYHNEDIVCPCCGSDLSIFRVIDKIPGKSSKVNLIWKTFSGAICILAVVLSVTIFNLRHSIECSENELSQVRDSVMMMENTISDLNNKLKQKNQISNQYHKHIVLPGDNLWKISRRFYGTGKRYTDIAKWNKMSIDDNIAPGDTILIK